MTWPADIRALGRAISDGALPSLRYVEVAHGYVLDREGELREAVELLASARQACSVRSPTLDSLPYISYHADEILASMR